MVSIRGMAGKVVMTTAMLISAGCARAVVDPAGIGWQAHSYNDMRSWQQLFRKADVSRPALLKIDLNWCPTAVCHRQQRLRDPTDPRGCLLLNHDNPTLLTARPDYNTSEDLIRVFEDRNSSLRGLFQRPVAAAIALCFKRAPQDCHGHAAVAWMSLVDEMVARLQAAVAADPALRVEFVLDGGEPALCRIERWRPWVSTSGPHSAFIHNDTSSGDDRWEVLNPSWGPMMQSYAAAGWGKFVNSTRAFQVWEPSDQADILAAAHLYIDTGIPHQTGLRFAINIDPAKFEVYASPVTRRGLSAVVGTCLDAPALGVVGSSFVISHSVVEPDGKAVLVRFLSPQGILQTEARLPAWPDHSTPRALSSRECGNSASLIVSGPGVAALYTISPVRHVSLDTSINTTKGTVVTLVQSLNCSDVPSFVSARWSNSKACTGVMVSIFDAQLNLTIPKAKICIPATTVQLEEDSDMAVAAARSKYGETTVLLAVSSNGNVYLAIVHFSITNVTATKLQLADVGRDPSVSALVPKENAADALVFAVTYTDSFCQNTEDRNKQAEIASCSQKPKSDSGAINYIVGTQSEWQQQLAAAGFITSCSEHVLHGTIDVGSRPSIALVELPTRTHSTVALALLRDTTIGATACGLPSSPANSTVLHTWTLPH